MDSACSTWVTLPLETPLASLSGFCVFFWFLLTLQTRKDFGSHSKISARGCKAIDEHAMSHTKAAEVCIWMSHRLQQNTATPITYHILVIAMTPDQSPAFTSETASEWRVSFFVGLLWCSQTWWFDLWRPSPASKLVSEALRICLWCSQVVLL